MLKELVVISGKGGTGKTSVVAALASLIENNTIADCDVDAADLHLVLQPQVLETENFWSGKTAVINNEKCVRCGKCLELCRFQAIREDYVIDKISCEGCGVCVHYCPAGAIDFKENLCGHVYVSKTPYGYLAHAKLGIAEENSGKLVTLVKSRARQIAQSKGYDTVIVDGPPGIGCPVIASLSGASLVLIVAEPTLSGVHDLQRVLKLAGHFKIPTCICINKADINQHNSDLIKAKAQTLGIKVLGLIPYDEAVTKAQTKGVSVLEFSPDCPASIALKIMAKKLSAFLNAKNKP